MIPGYLAGALRGRPLIDGYRWRARTYPIAARAIRRAEALYGPPVPTCVCGGRMLLPSPSHCFSAARCGTCGQGPS